MTQQVETVSDLTPGLLGEWDDLAERVDAQPFMRPGWISAWWRAFGRGRLTVLTVRRNGNMVGLLPLARRRGVLTSLTNWHTHVFAPVAEDRSAIADMVEVGFRRASARLDLAFLARDSPLIEACERELGRRAAPGLHVRRARHSPYLDIEGSWEEYQRRFNSKMRNKQKRLKKRLQERGEVTIENRDGSEGLEGLLREGFGVEAAGGENKTPILASRRTTRFYTEVAEWAAARNWLQLWFLRVDGAVAAFAYGIRQGGSYYDLKVGYHPDFQRFGPGRLLLQARIQDGFETGLERFEFLGGPDPHKLEWTDTVHELIRVQAFPRSAPGFASRLLWVHGRPLAKRLVAAAQRE